MNRPQFTNRYNRVIRAAHWLMALTVIGMYPLGLYIDSLTYYDANYRTVPHWHKSIGLLFGLVLVIRLLWRVSTPQPAALSSHSAVEKFAARSMQWLLYGLMLLLVSSGYLISTADGRAIELFNWFSVPALPWAIENQEDIAGAAHYWIATSLLVLAGVHALAALKHHFIDKDSTLKRML